MRFARNATLVTSLLSVALASAASFTACTDEVHVPRLRPDGGELDADVDASFTDGGLSCGFPVPDVYESAAFATNAKPELDLRARLDELDARMAGAEGTEGTPVTGPELQAIFTAGAPSLRSLATAAAQANVDGYLAAFGDGASATWSPLDAEDGGTSAPGEYEDAIVVSGVGTALRRATRETLLAGTFYNHALALTSGPITEATIDELVAAFGASPSFAGFSDGDAGDARDVLSAAHAADRDDALAAAPGVYRRVAAALLRAKAAVRGGPDCRPDLDAALAVYFADWERATYLTVIYALSQAATHASATPQRGPQALEAFADAIGLAQSFKGIPQDRRHITDAQIDALLARVGAAAPYELVTRSSERVVAFNTAYQDIGAIFGLTQREVEDAKKIF